MVPETVDLFTCLAWVILIHSDAQTLDDDYGRVWRWRPRSSSTNRRTGRGMQLSTPQSIR